MTDETTASLCAATTALRRQCKQHGFAEAAFLLGIVHVAILDAAEGSSPGFPPADAADTESPARNNVVPLRAAQ